MILKLRKCPKPWFLQRTNSASLGFDWRREVRHMRVIPSILLLITLVLVATPDLNAQSTKTPSLERATSQQDIEISTLRAQLEVMRQYDRRLLSTVYWSLGGLLTIAALLIGFGWFANFRVYERDKAALAATLQADIEKRLSEIQRLTQSEVARRLQEIEEKARLAGTTAADALGSRIDARIERLQTHLYHLEWGLLEQEANHWLSRDVVVNAVRIQSEMLRLAATMKEAWRTSRALDAMHQALKIIADQRVAVYPDADLMREIVDVLGKVPAEHSIAVSNIKDLLTRIRAL
jgi:hypothetical protein